MTAAYADSSAIVKLYADDVHHEAVRSLDVVLVTSSLARVEVSAAFYGKARAGEIDIAVAQLLDDVFAAAWGEGRFVPVRPDAAIEAEAARLTARYPLRGFDAVHLATANAVRRAAPDCTTFACFDRRLAAAAAGEGFTLLAG